MRLLKAIYEDFEGEIKDLDGELDWGRGELPLVPHWLFAFLEDDKKRAITVERLRRVMQPIVEAEGAVEISTLREFLVSLKDDRQATGNARPAPGGSLMEEHWISC